MLKRIFYSKKLIGTFLCRETILKEKKRVFITQWNKVSFQYLEIPGLGSFQEGNKPYIFTGHTVYLLNRG